MRNRKILGGVALFCTTSLVALSSLGAASASETTEITTLNTASKITMDQAKTGLSFILVSEETNLVGYTSNISTTPTRYSEEMVLTNGRVGKISVENEDGYVSANLIPLPSATLRAARLNPDSLVSFTLGQTDIGKLSTIANPPAIKMASYLRYSPAGMWDKIFEDRSLGVITLGTIQTFPSPGGGARFVVPVNDARNSQYSYIFETTISPEGYMTSAKAYAADIYSYTVTVTGLGPSIEFLPQPKKVSSWEVIDAAQWRIEKTPTAVAVAAKAQKQATADKGTRKGKQLVSLIRLAANSAANSSNVAGAAVKAWDIKDGARIEIRRTGYKNNIWTVGACITVEGKSRSVVRDC